jgi:(2Fe-2S) ferredoxin
MSHSHASSFCVVGQFLGYELKSHKIYRVYLQQGQDEYCLKLSSSARDDLLRAALNGNLKIGDWMQVSGLQEMDRKKGLKLKAHSLSCCDEPRKKSMGSSQGSCNPTKVLVCQKSSCCKRGGKAVMEQLQKVVSDRQLDDEISIKGTGCMGKCSKGPVMVIDKTHYRQVNAKTVSHLLDHHMKDS